MAVVVAVQMANKALTTKNVVFIVLIKFPPNLLFEI